MSEDLFSWRSNPHEITNTLTHGAGAVLSLIGAAVLIGAVSDKGAGPVLALSVYAAALVSVYVLSTLSHAFAHERWRKLFRQLDQGSIYLLVAASFSAFGVAYLKGAWWVLAGAVWTAAIYGFVAKIFFAHRVDRASIVLPIAMGWAPTLSFRQMFAAVPMTAFWLLLAGGVCYTAGAVLVLYDRKFPWLHGVWHVLVIAGSVTHYLAILWYAAA